MQDTEYESILHQWLGMVTSAELAEIDGFVCGLVSRQGSPQQLCELLFTDDAATADRLEQCRQAMELRHLQIAAFGDVFEPLIEGDDSPLAVQAASLATWCYGFLATLGDEQGLREYLSDESFESLQDIQAIRELDTEELNRDDEGAFSEVYEYVRVAVSLIFTDLAAASFIEEDETLH